MADLVIFIEVNEKALSFILSLFKGVWSEVRIKISVKVFVNLGKKCDLIFESSEKSSKSEVVESKKLGLDLWKVVAEKAPETLKSVIGRKS